jgi:hypothetical protein
MFEPSLVDVTYQMMHRNRNVAARRRLAEEADKAEVNLKDQLKSGYQKFIDSLKPVDAENRKWFMSDDKFGSVELPRFMAKLHEAAKFYGVSEAEMLELVVAENYLEPHLDKLTDDDEEFDHYDLADCAMHLASLLGIHPERALEAIAGLCHEREAARHIHGEGIAGAAGGAATGAGVGAAVGGPVGAVAGAALGGYAGSKFQDYTERNNTQQLDRTRRLANAAETGNWRSRVNQQASGN